MLLSVPTGPWLLACLLIDPREAGRQDYNSKKMTGRGRLHSYVQGATRPLSSSTYFSLSLSLSLSLSCFLAYQSLEVVKETLVSCGLYLLFLNDVPAPADSRDTEV
jgi:hypothetical protein